MQKNSKNKYFFGLIFMLITGIGLFILFQSPMALTNKDQETNGQTKAYGKVNIIKEHKQRSYHTSALKKEQPVIKYFSEPVYITAIGDSLTQGIGDETKQGGYVGVLEQMFNKRKSTGTFDNFGKRGNRSDQLLKRLNEPAINSSIQRANIVLITIGANDIMQVLKENITNLEMDDFTTERQNYENRLVKIIGKIKRINPATDIYLLGFYNPFARYFKDIQELEIIAKDWNTTGENITKKIDHTYFIPMMDLFDNTAKEVFADDNFHPNHLGYQLIAERVLEYINKEKEDDSYGE
ncbi:SGNH/GDSL hydrolase family protein [Cerasibacillus sp. JNUCC 74]